MQIIPRRKSFGEEFGEKFGSGLGTGFSSGVDNAIKKNKDEKSKQALQALIGPEGEYIGDLPEPLQKYAYEAHLKHKEAGDKLRSNKAIVDDLEQKRNLPPGSLEAYANDPSMAERVSRPQKDKSPLGGLGGTAVEPEIAEAIDRVIRENPEATAEELELSFNKAGIPPGRTHEILESRRRAEDKKAQKIESDKKRARDEEIEFHKETAKYDEDLIKRTKVAKNQVDTIQNIQKALNSGNVKPSAIANILKEFGPIGELMAKAYINEDQATLLASIPSLLEGWKEVFGVRLSDADLRILQDKLPDIGKSVEANQAVLRVLKKYGEQTLLRSQIANDIKKSNNGLRPLGYAERIEERFDDMTKSVAIINPRTGNTIQVPAYKVGDAIKAGARLADEQQPE